MKCLVEYRISWAGKVVEHGVDEVEANHEMDAERIVRQRIQAKNRKAVVEITWVVGER